MESIVEKNYPLHSMSCSVSGKAVNRMFRATRMEKISDLRFLLLSGKNG